MNSQRVLEVVIPEQLAGLRIDKALALLIPQYSRTTIQGWLREGAVRVAERRPQPRELVACGQHIVIDVPRPRELESQPQEIPIDVVFEDEHLFVINKPAGIVVHPGAGNPDGTLLNALLHRDPALAQLPRAGIVHRLDKDTSGLMVVARTERARQQLIEQLRLRDVTRIYLAFVYGIVISGGNINAPLGRDVHDRLRMAVTSKGKPAITTIRVVERFRAHTLVRAALETGRTHQIRVHLSHRGFPIVGDAVYGGRLRVPPRASPQLAQALSNLRRQALHASELQFAHPATAQAMHWRQPLPEDLAALRNALSVDLRQASVRE